VPLNLEQKKAVVAEVAKVASSAHSLIAAEYIGLSVAEMTELRAKARKEAVKLRVVPNTLAKRALEGGPYECLRDGLVGPLMLAFSQEDPGAAPRVISEFAKDNDKLVVKLVALSGRRLAPSDIETLAKLPSREQAIAMLLGVMQAPISKLVRTLAGPHAKLVRTLAAIRDQKQAA
jgi:large subunit ribosomal protein L10